MKPAISAMSRRLECTRIASAPAAWYASARCSASSIGCPEISASVRATMQKLSSVCASLPARMRPQNSSVSASFWRSPRNEFVFGNSLSSRHTPAIPRSPSFLTRRRTLLKLPYPVSPSTRIGSALASAMNSSTSSTCVQDASLLSRNPSEAEIDRPDAQMPANPASSTILADSPLCASIRNDRPGEQSRDRSSAGRVWPRR